MHGAESFKAIQYSFSVSKYEIPKYSHPEIMIYKIFSFHKHVHILQYGTYSNKFLLLFFIMPKNAPHKTYINCEDITPTCFSENTPSSVSPKTHCSNILTIYLYLLWYYKRKKWIQNAWNEQL